MSDAAHTKGLCGNRGPISGDCIIGCGGFGSCRYGHEDHIRPREEGFNPFTGTRRAALAKAEGNTEKANG